MQKISVLLGLFFLLFSNVVHASETLNVCLDSDNAPFSDQESKSGIDLDLAHALAKKGNEALEIIWVDIPLRGGLAKAIRTAFHEGKCDVFMSVPSHIGFQAEFRENEILFTDAYLDLTYLPVVLKSFEQDRPLKKLRFGARSSTPADLLILHNKLRQRSYNSNQDVLSALINKEIDVGFVWAPDFSDPDQQFLVKDAIYQELEIYEAMSWGIVMAVRTQKKEQLDTLNARLSVIQEDDILRSVLDVHQLVTIEMQGQ